MSRFNIFIVDLAVLMLRGVLVIVKVFAKDDPRVADGNQTIAAWETKRRQYLAQ